MTNRPSRDPLLFPLQYRAAPTVSLSRLIVRVLPRGHFIMQPSCSARAGNEAHRVESSGESREQSRAVKKRGGVDIASESGLINDEHGKGVLCRGSRGADDVFTARFVKIYLPSRLPLAPCYAALVSCKAPWIPSIRVPSALIIRLPIALSP